MGRFDYVRYDEHTVKQQATFKAAFEALDLHANLNLKDGRAKALVITKLEEAYMWVGKALRDQMPESVPNEERG